MKQLMIIFLLLQINIQMGFAQPGGGGGLRIETIIDYNGKAFIKGDNLLTIQHFALSKDGDKELFEIVDSDENQHQSFDKENSFFCLPPYIYQKKKKKYIPNQRLILMYANDTMTIDILDILPENAAGNRDVLKTIYFISAHYKSYRNPVTKIKTLWFDPALTVQQKMDIGSALKNGINTNTDYLLTSIGLLERKLHPDVKNKMLERSRKSCVEDRVNADFYTLCDDNILITDSIISIYTSIKPLVKNNINFLHFVYYFSFDYKSFEQNKETELALSKLNKFEEFKLQINDSNYSGFIKLAIPFRNAGITSRHSGYNLWIVEYLDGNLLTLKKLNNVHIITEEYLIH